jgi:hypothetical protein
VIWIWLCLLSGLALGLLIVVGLLVDRWWGRRKARKHAEALARQAVADLMAAVSPVGEALLSGFRQLVPVLNRMVPELEKLAAAVSTAESDPDSAR